MEILILNIAIGVGCYFAAQQAGYDKDKTIIAGVTGLILGIIGLIVLGIYHFMFGLGKK